MKKSIEVVMLPTEEKTKLRLDEHGVLTFEPNIQGLNYDGLTHTYQHLYVTISQDVEPIKVNDWCYDSKYHNIFQWKGEGSLLLITRKIICTNDPKLTTELETYNNQGGKILERLPQLQQSFLKEFVANPNGKYEVEYDLLLGDEEDENQNLIPKNYLKVNQDNTLNITSVEQKMYSREEVERLCRLSFGQGVKAGIPPFESKKFQDLEDNWIKENL